MAYGVFTDEDRRRARELQEWHDEWSESTGVDGPVPAGRTSPSDFNQHVPVLEAGGSAQDEFHTRAREIMGLAAL